MNAKSNYAGMGEVGRVDHKFRQRPAKASCTSFFWQALIREMRDKIEIPGVVPVPHDRNGRKRTRADLRHYAHISR